MDPRTRVLAALAGKMPDRVPIHHIGFSSAAASLVLGREAYVGGGVQQFREATALWEGEDAHRGFLHRSLEDAFDLAQALHQDILRLRYWRMPTKPTARLSETTFLYGDQESAWRIMRYDPDTELYQVVARHPVETAQPSFESIEAMIVRHEEALDRAGDSIESFPDIEELIRTYASCYVVRVEGGSLAIPYEPVWLEAVVARPDLVGRFLDVQMRHGLRRIAGLERAGVRVVFGGGDLASSAGPFYSPEAFRSLMLPRLQRLTDACHQRGMYYLFGTDGNTWEIADDLLGASGVDGYFEIDRAAGMDMNRLRERFPDLVLIGNVSSLTLHRGGPTDVDAETRSCLEAASAGRAIVGVSNYVLKGTPPVNLRAMMRAIESAL